jgi:hypothetical protein
MVSTGSFGRKAGTPFVFSNDTRGETTMRYRVYVGPLGSEAIAPLQKDRFLFKEFTTLDDAFSWARHVNRSGRVTLAIDGDNLTKREIAAALNQGEDIRAA